ncbi:phosphomevalonate decarboxylase MvaD [Salinirubellus salinus]|jgi:phosphomevalonate decarboxylase|uniref:Phosphomevalonate decarboxylase MvaD n=1 Tax=Salinirubellus salinus TaxID=1364945 RepID=A0A9E7R4U7_9EURY|nr:phosphomevalonate decarboxylase MvaD [Salinirubellus salinus]UWM55393.1 phosphomevalonate decarboxylase MvaD [Salinirubellus salinus]
MKATARAHPIQGLVKYHGMRDEELRLPYHDSISLCTAPSASTTTVEFGAVDEDVVVIDGETVDGRGLERVLHVVDHVRDLAGIDDAVRFESESNFPTNIGFGSSSSGFAAAAVAACEAAGLDLTHEEMSAIARRGSSSAARAVTGAFSHLRTGLNDEDCRSERIPVPDEFEEDLRIVACEIPAFKHTEEAHKEAAESHMFEARLAHIHGQIAEMRDGLRRADFDDVYGLAEEDSLSLAATTMTGPAAWVYWKPETLEVFETVRELRREADVPVYFSVDTGASVYLNTTRDAVDEVQAAIEDLGIETRVWRLGGPARVLDESEALF